MIILHITDIANPNGNGVAAAVKDYLKYENKENDVAVYNLDSTVGEEDILKFSKTNYNSISSLPTPFNKPDIVVFNEVFKLKYIKLANECIRNNIKYVIIPHGCLSNYSRKIKRSKYKKIVAINLLLRKFIKNAAAIQYLNEREKNETKIYNKKYIISGNGIDLNLCKKNKPTNSDFVYIGRYSIYIKGLDVLVEMCSKYRDWFEKNNVKIQLYGRDSINNLKILCEMIKKYNVENIIIINGPVYGEEKEKILCDSYAFIQTSRTEGQPMGILEALGYGIPCIVTEGTSFADYVNDNSCGYGSKIDIDEIFINIKNLYENKDKRNEMSKNAYNAIKKDFTWENVIKKCTDNYKKL